MDRETFLRKHIQKITKDVHNRIMQRNLDIAFCTIYDGISLEILTNPAERRKEIYRDLYGIKGATE